jgi:hypothetical protein
VDVGNTALCGLVLTHVRDQRSVSCRVVTSLYMTTLPPSLQGLMQYILHAHSLVLTVRIVCLYVACFNRSAAGSTFRGSNPSGVGKGDFSLPVQNCPEANLTSCTLDIRSFAGLNWPERDADQPYTPI